MKIKSLSKKVVVFSMVVALLDVLIGSIQTDGNPLSGLDFVVTRISSCLLGALLITKLDLWSSVGFHKRGYCNGILLGMPLIVMGIASGIISNLGQFDVNSFLGISTLLFFTFGMFLVGLAEEIVYRGLILNNMLKHWGDTHQGVWKCILVSAAIFGIAHLPNMLFAPALTVVVQAINAAAGGILFSAAYIKSKNMWAVVSVHAAVDWFALIPQVCFSGTSVVAAEMSLPQAVFIIFAGFLPPLFFAWLYIGSKEKYER